LYSFALIEPYHFIQESICESRAVIVSRSEISFKEISIQSIKSQKRIISIRAIMSVKS
jgi:hypothetical protein